MKGKVGGYWNKIFMEILGLLFRVNVTWFFCLSVRSPRLNHAHYILAWFERSLKLADKIVLDR